MRTRILFLIALAACGFSAVTLRAQNSAFTYQGRLQVNHAPWSGTTEMRFSLFSEATGGMALALSTPATASVGVSNGLFTTTLDFGSAAFLAGERWLEIQVRTDAGSFVTLTPRQPITPAPCALTALHVAGVSGHALHSFSGGVTNALFVAGTGHVGIGLTNPASKLHVISSATDGAPPRLQSDTAGQFGAGWDFYHGQVGKGYVGVPDAGAGIAPGELVLYGGPQTPVSLWSGGLRALTATPIGVGIGTAQPFEALEVRGNIRLGFDGELRAPGGEENLRIIRGRVFQHGQIGSGRGFTVTKDDLSFLYTIHFTTPFAVAPTVTATAEKTHHNAYPVLHQVTTDQFTITIKAAEENINTTFHFIAIGPR